MRKWCPPSKLATLRQEIQAFKQLPDERLEKAWERFKAKKMECPAELFTQGEYIKYFYNGLRNQSKFQLDQASLGGVFYSSYPSK